MKKLISVILVLTMLLSMASVSYAAEVSVSGINSAKTALELKDELSKSAYADTPSDVTGVFYDLPIFARLTTIDYASYDEFTRAYNREVEAEKATPYVNMLNSYGNKITSFESGSFSIKVNSIESGLSVYGVIFENGRLFALKKNTSTAAGATLEYTNITFNSKNTYTFKLVELKDNATLELDRSWMYTQIAAPTATPSPYISVAYDAETLIQAEDFTTYKAKTSDGGQVYTDYSQVLTTYINEGKDIDGSAALVLLGKTDGAQYITFDIEAEASGTYEIELNAASPSWCTENRISPTIVVNSTVAHQGSASGTMVSGSTNSSSSDEFDNCCINNFGTITLNVGVNTIKIYIEQQDTERWANQPIILGSILLRPKNVDQNATAAPTSQPTAAPTATPTATPVPSTKLTVAADAETLIQAENFTTYAGKASGGGTVYTTYASVPAANIASGKDKDGTDALVLLGKTDGAQYITFDLYPDAAGVYEIDLVAAGPAWCTTDRLSPTITVDNVVAHQGSATGTKIYGSRDTASSGGYDVCQINKFGTVTLKSGKNTVKIYLEQLDDESWANQPMILGSIVLRPEGMEPSDTGLETIIYVSTTGSDSNNGLSSATPVKTVAKAKELAASAAQNTSENVIVNIASGVYNITSPITFDGTDGTSGAQRIIFRGAADGSSVISGGKAVTGWTAYQNGIYKATVSASAVREFYVNGVPQTRAKTEYTATSPTEGKIKATAVDSEGVTFKNSDLPSALISSPKGAEVVCNMLWTQQRGVVSGIKKVSSTTTKFLMSDPWSLYYAKDRNTNPGSEGAGKYSTTRYYFYVENSLSLLDKAGEFYYNASTSTLYYKPQSGVDLNDADCYIGVSEGLINITGTSDSTVSNIKFEDLTFEGGTWLEPSSKSLFFGQAEKIADEADGSFSDYLVKPQIDINYANTIIFDGVTVRNVGSTAIAVRDSAKNIEVKNSDFTNIGGSAVSVGDPYYDKNHSTFANLITGKVIVQNNVITNTGICYAGCPAVSVYHAVNSQIISNTITDATYSGISIGWGWGAEYLSNTQSGGHLVQKNFVDGVMTLVEDGAPIYTLGKLPNGLTIDQNYFGDATGVIATGYHGGIYCDEGSTNVTATKNVVTNPLRWLYARTMTTQLLQNIIVDGNFSVVDTDKGQNSSGAYFVDTNNVKITNHTVSISGTAAQNIIMAAGATR